MFVLVLVKTDGWFVSMHRKSVHNLLEMHTIKKFKNVCTWCWMFESWRTQIHICVFESSSTFLMCHNICEKLFPHHKHACVRIRPCASGEHDLALCHCLFPLPSLSSFPCDAFHSIDLCRLSHTSAAFIHHILHSSCSASTILIIFQCV